MVAKNESRQVLDESQSAIVIVDTSSGSGAKEPAPPAVDETLIEYGGAAKLTRYVYIYMINKHHLCCLQSLCGPHDMGRF